MKINGKYSLSWVPFAMLFSAVYFFIKDFMINAKSLPKTAFFVVAFSALAFGLLDKLLVKVLKRSKVTSTIISNLLMITLWVYFFSDYLGWKNAFLNGGLFLAFEIIRILKCLKNNCGTE